MNILYVVCSYLLLIGYKGDVIGETTIDICITNKSDFMFVKLCFIAVGSGTRNELKQKYYDKSAHKLMSCHKMTLYK